MIPMSLSPFSDALSTDAVAASLPLTERASYLAMRRRAFWALGILGGLVVLLIAFMEMFGPTVIAEIRALRAPYEESETTPPFWVQVLFVGASAGGFLISQAATWWLRCGLALLMFDLLLRLPSAWSFRRLFVLLIVMGFPFVIVHVVLSTAVLSPLPVTSKGWIPRNAEPWTMSFFLPRLFTGYFAYIFLSGFGLTLLYVARYHARREQAVALQAQLAEARLQALKMQLHPHFLFNTLNAIVTLVRKQDTTTAAKMLTRLGDLLRRALDEADTQEVPLRQELAFIERYLSLEKLRLQDGLEVHIEVDGNAHDALVPNLILQPLVENAIQHGIAQKAAAGQLWITARASTDQLHLSIRDSGPGFAEDWQPHIGLANTQARLQQQYGDQATLETTNHSTGGAVVNVVLPLNYAEGTPALVGATA